MYWQESAIFQISTYMYYVSHADCGENKKQRVLVLLSTVLKVRSIQNEFMKSFFLPDCQPKIPQISALPFNKLPGQKSLDSK